MMKGKDRFTSAEIVKLRELITERQNAPRNSQKQLRNRMRKIGFFGRDDWGIIDCTLDDLDELIDTGKIKIIDKTTSTIITDKSKSKNAIINQGTNKNKDSNWINRIDFGEIESFKNEGFYGFVSVKSLLNNYSQIPAIRGVYMVLRIITKEPFFLDKGSGGYFKGTDPNVAIIILQEKWVYNTPVLYIGKAGGEGKEVHRTAYCLPGLSGHLRSVLQKRLYAAHDGAGAWQTGYPADTGRPYPFFKLKTGRCAAIRLRTFRLSTQ